ADIVYSWQKLGGPSTNSKIKINRHPSAADTLSGQPLKGYIIEAAIPLAELGLRPGNGLHVGFNLALCDDDDPSSVHPFMQELQFSWSRRRNNWQNPTAFADLFFVEGPSAGSLEAK
ncbi:MAG: sugar-binding protein, partial [bacterium]